MGMRSWMAAGPQIGAGRTVDTSGVNTVTPAVYAERGYYMTPVGYRTAPWITHPDDLYVRTPASPTLDRAWQGFQKHNALSDLQYASRHPGWGPDVPEAGVGPHASPYPINTMQFTAARTATVQKTPARAYGTIGPGMSWVPNPTAPGGQSSAYAGPPPGLLRSILNRLGVSGG